MRVRGVLGVVGATLVAAGCGAGGHPPGHGVIHLDGKRAQGDYVFENDASGARFLVPASVLAGQGRTTFDVAVPAKAAPGGSAGTSPTVGSRYRAGVASATAVVPHAAHVEVLATGAPGRFALSWEETCGWTRQGQAAVGGTGGQGVAILRSPAVTLVKLPRINGGVPSCYLAATATTTTFTRHLRLAIIDY